MKDPKYYFPLIGAAIGDGEALTEVIRSIQKDAVISGFQNTSEEFNIEAIQGNDNWHNEAIYQKLMS